MKLFTASLYTELIKIVAKPRSYIGFIVITAIVALIQFAMWIDGLNFINFITGNVEQTFLIEGKILNGSLVTFIILQTLIVHIPLLIALVTGDLISGESAMGTLRALVSKPISRTALLLSKLCAGGIYTLLILLWLGIISLGLAMYVFGNGDLIVLKSEELIILPSDDLLWRFFCAFGAAFVALMVIASLSLMLSVFSDNSIGPIITTMGIIILFTIIGTMEIPIFDKVKPYLFTTHMIVWRSFFESPVDSSQILHSFLVMVFHITSFITIAIVKFNKKDILT
ncbi:MAG: hypothetical protein RIQ89_1002 [Bacteroidota bacterium]|jgi:ABC-2 type transport system permease protein